MYRVSQELIDLLIKNGFRNKSYLYSDFGAKYSSKNYSSTSKREFGFGKGKRRLGLHFDYINIFVHDGCTHITEEYTQISADRLKSIIVYFKSSYSMQEIIRDLTNHRIELSKEILDGNHCLKLSKAFLKKYNLFFEEVIL